MPTYYVRSSGGSDGNDGLSFANGWATVQYAADTAVGGDTVLVCADGTHLPTATVDFDTNAGTVINPITFRGSAADGTDDGTTATISGSGLGAGTSLINLNKAVNVLYLFNLRLTASKLYGIAVANTGTFFFNNCRVDTSSSHGFYNTQAANTTIIVWNCEIDSNGGSGFDVNTESRSKTEVKFSSIHDNASYGIGDSFYIPGYSFPLIDHCLIYDNGSDGINLRGSSLTGRSEIVANTIYGNTGDGIDLDVDSGVYLVSKNIIVNNGGYGINTHSASLLQVAACDYNDTSNNTSGAIDINGGVLPGTGNITEDPQFASVVSGSEDFTPQNKNLMVYKTFPGGGSVDYSYIGAITPKPRYYSPTLKVKGT